jgi:hypothetical protein
MKTKEGKGKRRWKDESLLRTHWVENLGEVGEFAAATDRELP